MVTLIIAIVGILILFLLSRAFGLDRNVIFVDEGAALDTLHHRHPDFTPDSSLLSTDRHSALFEDSSHGALGLVLALGDDAVTRIIQKGGIRRITALQDNNQVNGLKLYLDDVTCPEVKLYMSDYMRQAWLSRLQNYLGHDL